MVDIYGQTLSRAALAERTGALQQLAGVELVELADGPERGVRVLAFRTGAGLTFQVAVDRGFDLLAADWRGVPIGWRSPTGPRHPGLASPEESGGWGFLRSFTGLLATCGLDHALAPAASSAERYIYPGFARHDYPLHGRVAQIPAGWSAMASTGMATAARCGPRGRSPRWRCSARTCCWSGGSRHSSAAARSRSRIG